MTSDSLLDLWREAMTLLVEVSAPFLLTGLIVGLAVSIIQTATQLQEAILTFVPKLAAALIVIAIAGHWTLDRLGKFTTAAFTAASASHAERATALAPPP